MMDTERKLKLLADASRFDLACACGSKTNADHRRRGSDGLWLYPVALPGGGTSIMLKTLLSNACVNDCRYCPFRSESNVPRCTLEPEEIANRFMDFVHTRAVFGLFLSSGVVRDPDHTMSRLVAVAELLRRRHGYRGFIHLKIIPGASDAAVEQALALSSAVSLNAEVPTRAAFQALSRRKDYRRDIVRPIRLISALTARGAAYARVRQTTQFVVGASSETDAEIVKATFGLYRRLGLNRVYYSAYQRGHGAPGLPGEQAGAAAPADLLTREHRLYQADFLMRAYKWDVTDILFEDDGSLSLGMDPKQCWAERHPEFFPVRLLSSDRDALLRVPGLGPVTARRILEARRSGRNWTLRDVGIRGRRLGQIAQHTVWE